MDLSLEKKFDINNERYSPQLAWTTIPWTKVCRLKKSNCLRWPSDQQNLWNSICRKNRFNLQCFEIEKKSPIFTDFLRISSTKSHGCRFDLFKHLFSGKFKFFASISWKCLKLHPICSFLKFFSGDLGGNFEGSLSGR